MYRRTFIQQIVSVAALTMLPRHDRAGVRRSLLLEAPVAGFRYYEGPHLIKRIAAGDPLMLKREPDNSYDNMAISVYWRGSKIGYIPRADNTVLARLIDADTVAIAAQVSLVDPTSAPWDAVEVEVYMVKGL